MNKNLIIITSIINPVNNPLSYTKIRTIFSPQQRYEQLLKTIISIKNYIPNYFIVLLECSDGIEKFEGHLKEITDKYINYNKDTQIKNYVDGKYKSLGEWSQLTKFINNEPLENYNSLIKISGRYFLNDKFNYELFDNDKNIFRFYKEHNMISTRLYKISKKNLFEYIKKMNNFEAKLQSGLSIEEVITQELEYEKVENIGVSGYIAVTKNCFIDE